MGSADQGVRTTGHRVFGGGGRGDDGDSARGSRGYRVRASVVGHSGEIPVLDYYRSGIWVQHDSDRRGLWKNEAGYDDDGIGLGNYDYVFLVWMFLYQVWRRVLGCQTRRENIIVIENNGREGWTRT
ncbi:putative cytochrome P450 superfamily protein isoform X4 [Iris pallida]|uniref:Cytochrome P450 superfamily protein isoform X4 n=1 Tax=Iris pallida TaxID=29817 RepID=A0AAX6GH35_IRIPA|nr:putative cytochrome P450 superfamily protein isoform X4 [Iris pallida]KAJ6834875.1 putative cytochrome P450 superfamily protein isoform X4 [Iris pallida]